MRILYVTTILATMGFFTDEFNHLKAEGHTIELACNRDDVFGFDIENAGMPVHNIPFSRSPFTRANVKAYTILKRLVRDNKYDIVHCHTPNAAAVTRLACKGIRQYGTKVIYTAHGFHFYKGAPKKNWLVFYPVEWLCAHWTDVLLTMNSEDFELAKKKFKAGKIDYVPGIGINLSKFADTLVDIRQKRRELHLPEKAIVLLSVGELNDNKNHETVIRAVAGLDVYYVIAGKGVNEEKLKKAALEAGMNERVQFLGFRSDIPELLAASDFFVFPSYREGLSVSLMETMASGKSASVSRIRGNTDLIDDNGGTLFNPYSVEECREAIVKLIHSDREKMGLYNKEKIKNFGTERVLNKIDEAYTL